MRARRWPGEVALWCAALAALLWVLQVVAGRALPAPPLAPDRWWGWVGQVGAGPALAALVRLVGLAIGWYLALLTVAGIVLRQRQSAHVLTTDRLSPGFLRRLLARGPSLAVAAGLGLAIAPLLLPLRPGSAPSPNRAGLAGVGTASLELVPESLTARPLLPRSGEAPPDSPTPVSPAPLVPKAVPRWLLAEAGVTAPDTREEPANAPEQERYEEEDQTGWWTVEVGDHLWGIAAATLEDRWGRGPNDQETAAYWLAVLEANRDSLVDPDNPDLIYPGQRIDLPAHPDS